MFERGYEAQKAYMKYLEYTFGTSSIRVKTVEVCKQSNVNDVVIVLQFVIINVLMCYIVM
jgi:hypothetical protein